MVSPNECRKQQAWQTYRSSHKVNFDDLFLEKELAEIAAEKARQNGSYQEKFCECAELLIHGVRAACPAYHDCSYVRQRTSLIAMAIAKANYFVPRVLFDPVAGDRWTKEFARAMDQLSEPLLHGTNGTSSVADQA
jgi:hypothetical protein